MTEACRLSFIYKITSPTGKVYIGQTLDLRVRLSAYRTNKCKNQKKLYASLCKYGFINHTFETLKVCDALLSDYWEIYYIRENDSYYKFNKNGLNLTLGGHTNAGRVVSEATKKAMSKAMRGRRVSDETKEKLRRAFLGTVMTEDTKKKISDKLKGKIKSKETVERMRSRWEGRRALLDVKRFLKRLAWYATKEDRLKNHRESVSAVIFDNQTGVYYYSIQELVDESKMPRRTLDRHFNKFGSFKERYIHTGKIQ